MRAVFKVVPSNRQALLGAADCERIGLVQRVDEVQLSKLEEESKAKIRQEHPRLWRGDAVLPGWHSFRLKDDASGVINAARRIAFAKRPKVKMELEKQAAKGVLTLVSEPTDWVNSMVVAEKRNGDIRFCIDPNDLNKALKREHSQIPTKEKVLANMAGARYFSKMDAKSGFHQIRLDKKSSLMTTFNTPFGRYRYNRLPMGICSAPEVFQKAMSQHLEDLEGFAVIHDDIVVWAETEEEQDARLDATLRRLEDIGLGLNYEKCLFKMI